jgi:hydroxyacylglutathione hydrolase
MNPIITIKAFNDNFIYLRQYDRNNTIAIDPGDSTPVLKELEKNNLFLSAILLTHHHSDHTGGASELKKKTGCKILSGDGKRINAIDYVVQNKQILTFGNINIEVVATPGHTNTSVCYYVHPVDNKNGILFTGDTLFIGGCGRLFECDAQTMWESLQKLAALPKNTLIYPGHDYTLENYKFAQQVEPDNQLISEQIREIKQGKPTIPSTIANEKETNIFLQANTAEIFADLRHRKDIF